jgi:uncharacterized protein (TIGR00251 family)
MPENRQLRPWLESSEQGVILRLKVQPNAARTHPRGLWRSEAETRLKLRVAAPPVEGKANKAIVRWIAGALGVRSSSVRIIRGERDSAKTLLIEGADLRNVERALGFGHCNERIPPDR